MESATSQEASSPSPIPPRRSFFRWITSGLPSWPGCSCSGRLRPTCFEHARRRSTGSHWGAVGDFPPNETRRVTFDNPIRQPWDGIVAHAAVYVRYDGKDGGGQDQFLVLDVNCAHLGCPGLAGFPSRPCSCARVTAGSITPTAAAPPVRRRAVCSIACGASAKRSTGDSSAALSHVIRHAGETGLMHGTTKICKRKTRDQNKNERLHGNARLRRLGEWFDRRLGLRESLLPLLRHPIPRSVDGPMGWWYVFGSASMTLLAVQILDGDRPRPGLCAVGGQGVRQPALSERCRTARLVFAVAALLRRLGNGRAGPGPHDAGLSARRLQISARDDLGAGRLPAVVHAGNVFHGPGAAVGSRCVLGPGSRRVDGRTRARARAVDGPISCSAGR